MPHKRLNWRRKFQRNSVQRTQNTSTTTTTTRNCFRLRASSQHHYIRKTNVFSCARTRVHQGHFVFTAFALLCNNDRKQALLRCSNTCSRVQHVRRSSHNRIDTAAAAAVAASPAVIPTKSVIATRIFSLQLAAGAIKVTGRTDR